MAQPLSDFEKKFDTDGDGKLNPKEQEEADASRAQEARKAMNKMANGDQPPAKAPT